MASEYKNPTEVEMNKLVSSDIHSRNEALLAGDLLKAMDMAACMSAEKHAKMPCVTLVMDDLSVSGTAWHGQVFNIIAKVTRAFGSSMEVLVEVLLEDMFKPERRSVCQAFFVFVAIAKEGKAKLSHLDPVTMQEKLEYALAVERKKMRIAASKAEKRYAADDKIVGQITTTVSANQVAIGKTAVQSIQLVSPNDANHHHTTFGGQIMAWLVSVCTISATRLCQKQPSIIEVNGVHFLKPSKVGDRLVFKATVNKTFDDDSIEVGCRVESITLEGTVTHINSAYLTFVVFDDKKQRQPLPVVVATTPEEMRYQNGAERRRKRRVEKEKVLGAVGPALSVPWTEPLSDVLAFHNVSAFKKLYHLDQWQEISRENGCVLSTRKQDDLVCVKVEATVAKPAADVFQAVQMKSRVAWDPMIAQSEVVQKVDDDDSIVHVVMTAVSTADASSSDKPNDLLVLESSRLPKGKDGYVLAYRSVTLASYPPSDKYVRKENLSSGFMIQESDADPSKSVLTYINQLTNQVAAYMFNDSGGGSMVYAKRIEKLREFLKASA